MAVIKAQQDSLIQQTNAAVKTFNAANKATSCNKEEQLFEVAEDPDIEEKYNSMQTRVIQGSDLKNLSNTINLKPASPALPTNTSAQSVLFKKKATR